MIPIYNHSIHERVPPYLIPDEKICNCDWYGTGEGSDKCPVHGKENKDMLNDYDSLEDGNFHHSFQFSERMTKEMAIFIAELRNNNVPYKVINLIGGWTIEIE